MKPELKLVTYDQALILREFGFNEPVMYHFESKKKPIPNYLDVMDKERVSIDQFFIDYNVDYYISCPTIDQVRTWLRKQGIEIQITKQGSIYRGVIISESDKLPFQITQIERVRPSDKNDFVSEYGIYDFDGYDDCLIKGIDKILNLLYLNSLTLS